VPFAFVKNVVQIAFFMIPFIFPSLSPVTNISGKNFLGAFFMPKVPLKTGAPPPPNLLMLPTPLHL
jgi:hypothetical protein